MECSIESLRQWFTAVHVVFMDGSTCRYLSVHVVIYRYVSLFIGTCRYLYVRVVIYRYVTAESFSTLNVRIESTSSSAASSLRRS